MKMFTVAAALALCVECCVWAGKCARDHHPPKAECVYSTLVLSCWMRIFVCAPFSLFKACRPMLSIVGVFFSSFDWKGLPQAGRCCGRNSLVGTYAVVATKFCMECRCECWTLVLGCHLLRSICNDIHYIIAPHVVVVVAVCWEFDDSDYFFLYWKSII